MRKASPIERVESSSGEDRRAEWDRISQQLLQTCNEKLLEFGWPPQTSVSCPACGASLRVLLCKESIPSQHTENKGSHNNPSKRRSYLDRSYQRSVDSKKRSGR